jgi:hypothetical protein
MLRVCKPVPAQKYTGDQIIQETKKTEYFVFVKTKYQWNEDTSKSRAMILM